ncbi:MAG TPA: hypothetical protein VM425_02145 [Myxococcota bacterium]|nr:hypothetical protein [Myxococcota bacterium]
MSRITAIVALCLLLAGLAPGAAASESRSQALLYNLAFEDQTDVFLFPNLLPQYQGLYFHLPRTASNVYGGTIFNLADDSSLGLFVHRTLAAAFDQYRLSATDMTNYLGYALYNSGNSQEPHLAGQLFDLMYGAGKWGIGLRLHLWSDVSSQDAPLADPAELATAITGEINAGFRVMDGLNMRASVGLRSVSDNYMGVMFRFGARYLSPEKKRLRPVFAGQLEFGMLIPDTGDNDFAFCLPLKGGLRLTAIEDVLYIGLLGGLELQMYAPGAGDNRFGLVAPILEMAVEWYALDWLQLRTGIKGGYGVQLAGDPGDNMPKHEQLAFSSGLGIPLGPFAIDAVVQYSLWQDGPYFVGGAPGLFAGVSLSYLWGKGVRVPTRLAEPEPVAESKPAPAPEAKPKPAPAAATRPKVAPVTKEKPAPATKDKPAEDTKDKEKANFEGWR